jgi:uncharacterized protein YyaL (SSP411 family)
MPAPSDQATTPPAATDASAGAPPAELRRGQLRFVDDYAQGAREAASQRKPMLVFFTASWCHFCHQMADEAFTHPQVVRLSEQFVCVLIDADAQAALCRQFQVTGYPTIQFVSPRGEPIGRIVGKKPGYQVMIGMQAALQQVARLPSEGKGAL